MRATSGPTPRVYSATISMNFGILIVARHSFVIPPLVVARCSSFLLLDHVDQTLVAGLDCLRSVGEEPHPPGRSCRDPSPTCLV